MARTLPLAEFKAAIVEHLPQLERQARRLNFQATEAKDLVQETCRRALEARTQFSRGSDMRAWLHRILRNLFQDTIRRSVRETPLGDAVERVAAFAHHEPQAWTVVSDEEVANAIAALPPLYGEVYILHFVKKLSYLTIALRLGLPMATVGTRLMRARHHLREKLLSAPSVRYRSGQRTSSTRNRSAEAV